MIGIKQEYQNQNVTNIIMNELIKRLYQKNIDKFFIYTKPDVYKHFLNYDFKLLVETNDLILLENNLNSINDYYKNIPTKKGNRACIVMNLNPLTNGHLYLIEKASKENDDVILFLVEEDRSYFSYNDRYNILKQALKDYKNIHIIPSGPYIISKLTFPTYFIKDKSKISKIYMELDVKLFTEKLIPLFDIDKRYVGDEPLDEMTNLYNITLKKYLDDKLIIVPRLTENSNIISASLVRKLIENKDFETIKKYVPKATYDFIISKYAK
jgi:[citrate (pro-3S)-lyase] ligase